MLTLTESIEIADKVKLFEGEAPQFSDEQIDAAEFYKVKFNKVTFTTDVTLYNGESLPLGTVSFDDADIAIAFLEEYFELDDEEISDLDSYSWAGDLEDEFEELATNDAIVNNID